MITVDSLLPIISNDIKIIQNDIPKKDKRILLSLSKQMSSNVFLTENQAKLLVKIIKENIEPVTKLVPNVLEVLSDNLWSKTFREIKRVRKIYLTSEYPNNFVVEFSFNTRLKDKVARLCSLLKGNVFTSGPKYIFYLTEENISVVVGMFINDGFEIDQNILNYYEEIKTILNETADPFNVKDIKVEKFKSVIKSNLGDAYLDDVRKLQDCKIKYQYTIDETVTENTLADKIANRPGRKVYLNSDAVTLNDVFTALKDLSRFPVLLVFDGRNSARDERILTLLKDAVKSANLVEDIGIYFRYDKDTDTAKFNQSVSDLAYNKDLTATTVIAGISNNKIPKFMIRDQWKPKAVISFTTSFRSNKSYVYCSDVDLIVYYSASQPLDEEVHALV